MPRTAINYDNIGGNVTTPMLRSELRLFKRLGNGAFGVAYLAEFRGRRLVVKLPVTLLRNPETRVHPSVNPDGRTLAEVIRPPHNIRLTVFEHARTVFRKECQNAEQVLDSAVERHMHVSPDVSPNASKSISKSISKHISKRISVMLDCVSVIKECL
jgi:hypothetical protein